MKPETAGKVKYGVWGLICGAVISMIIGFGWVVGQPRTTQKMTEGCLGKPVSDLRRSVYEQTEP